MIARLAASIQAHVNNLEKTRREVREKGDKRREAASLVGK